jgi:hypothetical protein
MAKKAANERSTLNPDEVVLKKLQRSITTTLHRAGIEPPTSNKESAVPMRFYFF